VNFVYSVEAVEVATGLTRMLRKSLNDKVFSSSSFSLFFVFLLCFSTRIAMREEDILPHIRTSQHILLDLELASPRKNIEIASFLKNRIIPLACRIAMDEEVENLTTNELQACCRTTQLRNSSSNSKQKKQLRHCYTMEMELWKEKKKKRL
jgi:hypothetical protein